VGANFPRIPVIRSLANEPIPAGKINLIRTVSPDRLHQQIMLYIVIEALDV